MHYTELVPSRKATRSSPLRVSAQRFHDVQRELQQLDFFLKGTVLKRMMKCGQAQCACHRDPTNRLKAILARMERLSRTPLAHLAKQADRAA